MHILVVISACLPLLALASLLCAYSYGRFARRAQGAPSAALPVVDDATVLDRMIAPMLGAHPGLTGLTLLDRNPHAFAARVQSARSAGRSLDLQYYVWKDDLTGGLLSKEILAAADRGVRVRLLLDDINTRGDDSIYLALDRHPNIELRLFNPSRSRSGGLRRGVELLLRALSATRRMHNKLWIADGRVAIIGGRNIGDAYFSASETSNFHDMDLLLLGPGVAQAEAAFDSYWNCTSIIPIRALHRLRRGKLAKLRTRLDALAVTGPALPYLRRVIEAGGVPRMLVGAHRLHWTADAQVVSDPPEKVHGRAEPSWLGGTLFTLLRSARTELEIISPYFIPGEAGVSTLKAMTAAHVRVSVLTNSLVATDVAAAHGAYAHYRKPLLQCGVRLFELRSQQRRKRISLLGSSGASLHTKAFTVDRKSGFVGSFNFDPRSLSLNTEMGVLFGDEALAEEIRAVFAEQSAPRNSYRPFLKDGSIAWQDGAGPQARIWTREPVAGIWRRIGAMVVGALPVESQL